MATVVSVTAVLLSAEQLAPLEFRGLTVGVLNEDASLLPIATFDGGAWSAPWLTANLASAGDTSPSAATLREIPPAWWGGWRPVARWELLAADGGRRSIRARGVGPIECLSTLALTTDVRPRAVARDPPFETGCPPIPMGMASSKPGLLEPVSALPLAGADAQELSALLPTVFARSEPGLWAGSPERKQLAKRRSSPELNNAFAAPLPDGRRLIRFHASWPIPGIPSEPVTLVVGWSVREADGSRLKIVETKASRTDLDGKGGDFWFQPLAFLTVDGRTFWVGPANAYEAYAYQMTEVTGAKPRRVVFVMAGGM